MVKAQTRIYFGEWDAQKSLVYLDTDYLILSRRPKLVIVKKTKKQTFRIMDFAVPAENSEKKKVLRYC